MKDNGVVHLTFSLPKSLRERMRVVSRQQRITASQIIRDGIEIVVERHEEKRRVERERAEAEKARRFAAPTRLSDGPLAPAARPMRPKPTETARPEDSEDGVGARSVLAVIDEHVGRISQLPDSPMERRIAAAEAVADVKREFPLTHPDDDEIVVLLERRLRRHEARKRSAAEEARRAEPAESDEDDIVGKPVNLDKVRSYGDVGAGDETTTSEEGDDQR